MGAWCMRPMLEFQLPNSGPSKDHPGAGAQVPSCACESDDARRTREIELTEFIDGVTRRPRTASPPGKPPRSRASDTRIPV